MKTDIKQLIETIYDSKASQEARETARISLVNQNPEEALNVFAIRKDSKGLEFLSRNTSVPLQIRRNAYVERGIPCDVSEVASGEVLGYSQPTISQRSLDAIHKRQNTSEEFPQGYESTQGEIARAFRKEVGISEEDYQNWLKETQHKADLFRPEVNRVNEDMSPWQENALRVLEGD